VRRQIHEYIPVSGKALEGLVIVVTGASSGIGRAIALCAAAKGAHVVIVDQRDTPLEGGVPTTAADSSIVFCRGDVTRRDDLREVVEEAVRRWGRLDIWVNNACVDLTDPPHHCAQRLLDVSEEQWDRVQAVNQKGYFLGAQVAVKQFLAQEKSLATGLRGKVINVTSQHGMVACPGNIPYGTSKAAAAYMTKQIAVDYAVHSIACNAVAPGKIVKDPARPVAQYSLQRTPCARLGQPNDVATAVCWLASHEATEYITGATIMVDGGWMAF
jgi:NAD(P)-dependent dehydrogenase (short-subunit alcohol dehydrogenase family)